MILAGDSKNDIEENYGVVEDDAQNFDFSNGDNYSEEDEDVNKSLPQVASSSRRGFF